MGTQWVVGPGGVVGLNYSSLSEIWERLRIKKRRRDVVFDQLRTMEDAAILTIRGKR